MFSTGRITRIKKQIEVKVKFKLYMALKLAFYNVDKLFGMRGQK